MATEARVQRRPLKGVVLVMGALGGAAMLLQRAANSVFVGGSAPTEFLMAARRGADVAEASTILHSGARNPITNYKMHPAWAAKSKSVELWGPTGKEATAGYFWKKMPKMVDANGWRPVMSHQKQNVRKQYSFGKTIPRPYNPFMVDEFKGFASKNNETIASFKAKMPSVQNLKDQYFILFVRSVKVNMWYPINIVSGTEAAKGLQGVKENAVAKAVGIDRLLDNQVIRTLGSSIYKQKDEVIKQARSFHKALKGTDDYMWGYKEIMNNTKFNEKPTELYEMNGILIIPPEEELRNILDTVADASKTTSEAVAKVGDGIKGFLGGLGGGR